jgi:hypothetical protein
MNYDQVYAYVGNSPLLQHRAMIAVATAAVAVLNEAGSTPNHAARLAWAARALTDVPGTAHRMLFAIMANTTLQGSGDGMLDSDLQFVVNSLVDTFSALP